MIVQINPGESEPVTLVEPDDLKGFKAVVPAAGVDSLAEALGDAGWVADDSHVFIKIEALIEMAGDAATPEWREQFDGMVAYAREKGWLDPSDSAIRAHLETA
jgi:hypothetical protein